MAVPPDLPTLYTELADWWPILSAPEDYAEEAAFYRQTLLAACALPPATLGETAVCAISSGPGTRMWTTRPMFPI